MYACVCVCVRVCVCTCVCVCVRAHMCMFTKTDQDLPLQLHQSRCGKSKGAPRRCCLLLLSALAELLLILHLCGFVAGPMHDCLPATTI